MALVFDDGYADFVSHALPILKRYAIPASVYVVTDSVERGTPIWTYEVDHLLSHLPIGKSLSLATELHLHFRSEKLRIVEANRFKQALKKMPNHVRQQTLSELRTRIDAPLLPNLFLGWDELRALQGQGVTIGSHTCSHPPLATLDFESQLKELTRSGEVIQQHLGAFPTTISYPVGSYNQDTLRASEAAGYELGLAVDNRVYRLGIDSRFAIPRIELFNEPYWKSRLRFSDTIGRVKRTINR